MEMKGLYQCDNYKVLQVALSAGEKMPLHEATSDAFIICRKGKGVITFSDRAVGLHQGEHLVISACQPHQLEIIEDFAANIILENDGEIHFIKQGAKEQQPLAA